MNRADLQIPGIDDRLLGQYEPSMMWTELVNAKHEAAQNPDTKRLRQAAVRMAGVSPPHLARSVQ